MKNATTGIFMHGSRWNCLFIEVHIFNSVDNSKEFSKMVIKMCTQTSSV